MSTRQRLKKKRQANRAGYAGRLKTVTDKKHLQEKLFVI